MNLFSVSLKRNMVEEADEVYVVLICLLTIIESRLMLKRIDNDNHNN